MVQKSFPYSLLLLSYFSCWHYEENRFGSHKNGKFEDDILLFSYLFLGAFLSGRIVAPERSGTNSVFFRHWIAIGFESDYGPELSAVISLRGRISANRDVTK